MDTPEVVVSETSKESVESKASNPVEQTENAPVDNSTEPVKAGGEDAVKPDASKPEEGNSVIRQMRKQLRQQQKMIAEMRQAQMQAQPEPRPERESFNSDAEYVQAEVAFQLQKAQQAIPKTPDVFETKWNDARKNHADFDDALEDISHIMFTPDAQKTIRQAVETLPYGSDIVYHMAKNPELAEELSILPPAALAAKLGDIHGDIRISKTKQTVSKAPAPIAPVSGTPSKIDKSYDDITDQAEFMARRRREKEAYRKTRFGL